MFRSVLASLILLTSAPSLAADRVSLRAPILGPVEADLIDVIDGDTILVEARPWPQHAITVLVRIRGIDAPELKAKCQTARHAAQIAKQRLAQLTHGRIRLANIAGDKYFGRVVADVMMEDSDDVAANLLATGLVVTYDGGRKPSSCTR